MRRFVMMTHGKMAEGLRQSLTLFLGEEHPFEAVSCYLDDPPAADQIAAWFSTLAPEDEAVVLTDIVGGSVCQLVMPYLSRPQTFVLGGFNFPMLLQLACLPEAALNDETLHQLVESCRPSIAYVNEFNAASAARSDDE